MKVEVGCSCIVLDEDWLNLKTYRVNSIEDGKVELIKSSDYLREERGHFVEIDKVFASPFSLFTRRTSEEHYISRFMLDLSRSYFRSERRIELDVLVENMRSHPKLKNVGSEVIYAYLKCLVATKYLTAWSDKRKKHRKVFIEPSENARAAEKQREFAGTLGSELHELSERIRLLISHTGSVGTYRENLLRGLLKRSLPERYHVATGFIYGCSRQIDILIYDRIDYSPIFREDDLVVVSAASVRAVVEVKTNLTKVELKESIFLINELGLQDVGFPPFFKGIFAFDSDISQVVLKEALAVYRFEPISFDECENQVVILDPHQHVTSICVLNGAAGHVYYQKDPETTNYVPVLYEYTSATGLNSQAAFFLDSLLAHLRTSPIKEDLSSRILMELGADSIFTKVGSLTYPSWGPYMREEDGIFEMAIDEVERMEQDIEKYNEWLQFHIDGLS